jgi:hypothetical protein
MVAWKSKNERRGEEIARNGSGCDLLRTFQPHEGEICAKMKRESENSIAVNDFTSNLLGLSKKGALRKLFKKLFQFDGSNASLRSRGSMNPDRPTKLGYSRTVPLLTNEHPLWTSAIQQHTPAAPTTIAVNEPFQSSKKWLLTCSQVLVNGVVQVKLIVHKRSITTKTSTPQH